VAVSKKNTGVDRGAFRNSSSGCLNYFFVLEEGEGGGLRTHWIPKKNLKTIDFTAPGGSEPHSPH